MKKLKLKSFLFFLKGIIIFEFCSAYPKISFAKDFNKKKLEEINRDYQNLISQKTDNFFQTSKADYLFKYEVVKDLQVNGDKLFNLLAFEQPNLEKKNFLDINSDIQYKEKEVFHAEGNAIIVFSNAYLKGDLIKYDLKNKLLTVIGNVTFKKGEQYFEASKLYYNLKENTGYIDDIYGVLDNKTFTKDFKLEIDNKYRDLVNQNKKNEVSQIRYLKNSKISRLRYKADKLVYNSKTLESKKIFFTNDIFNEPQFIFLSNNFSAEIIEDNLRLLSRNSWIILENKLKIPIGRHSFSEGYSLLESGFGADYKDKDGYYLARGFYPRKLFKDYSFQITPYFLIQRALKGSTNSFTAKNSSIFSKKVKSDVKISDYFALDLNMKGKENDWDVESNIQLNSLNPERLANSLRTNLTFTKRVNLNKKVEAKKDLKIDQDQNNFNRKETKYIKSIFGEQVEVDSKNIYSDKRGKSYDNFLDFQFYNIFREEVINDFSTEDIYFASGFNLTNKKIWSDNEKNSNLTLIYDVGHFKSKSSKANEFKDLFRNALVAEYNYEFPLWIKSSLDSEIDESYEFSPAVISQSLNWSTGLQTGLFMYSDASIQSALKFNAGPILTLGSFKKRFLDYTYFSAKYSYLLKGGESPFSFDNINENPRIKFNLKQQIYGPILFSFDTILNLNKGTYSNSKYGLDYNRRSYSIGAFYNSSDESIGIRFNIFNFDYSGLNKKF